MKNVKQPLILWVMSLVAIAFGALTIKSGGAVLFFDGEARAAAGNYVGFVLWFNFLAGFAYIMAGIGLLMLHRYAVKLAIGIAVATVVVYGAFGVHIGTGGAYELRTVIAMAIRSLVWVTIAFLAYRHYRFAPVEAAS